jgi:glycerol-3-phosphate dehydrogenase
VSTPGEVRARQLAALESARFDLLVIGGGITGCGIARDAALRGLTVALVEKDDFASGTSSRSSRLIHGGVRYLEHGHLRLVFESSAERRRLLRLAPHLVRPLAFTWPVYTGARVPRWKLSAGLMLYDALAMFRNVGRHRQLSRRAVLDAEPSLRPEGLVGGARYFDAATDDARLTLANAVSAAEAGAIVVNHARAVSYVTSGGRATGATIVDALTGQQRAVTATAIVRAFGPWAGAVRGSKGAHIAVPRERIGNRAALTLLSPVDGRVLFTLPAGPQAIVGTTDSYTSSSPDEVRASREDVQYLIAAANRFFPAAELTERDVVSAWAGVRPLVPSVGDTPRAASREHAITTDAEGVISIGGGKLTTYRVMAADVVAAVLSRLGRPTRTNRTKSIALPGGDIVSLDATIADAARATGDPALAAHLSKSYGSRWRSVWREISNDDGMGVVVDGLPYTVGEFRYCAQAEMACTLGDLLIRRTHLAFETRDHGVSVAERVASAVAPVLGWDDDARRRAGVDYAAEVERVFSID